jgi:hypothetical protein
VPLGVWGRSEAAMAGVYLFVDLLEQFRCITKECCPRQT